MFGPTLRKGSLAVPYTRFHDDVARNDSTEAEKKLLAVLTSEQQAQLDALKGEPVEIDLSQLRRGRGGEGRRGRDRERAAAEASETDA